MSSNSKYRFLVMAALAAACIMSSCAVASDSPETPATIPDVAGMSFEDARYKLRGSAIRSENEFSDTVSSGRVIRTEPSAGETLPENGIVTIILSSGSDKSKVPDLKDDPVAEARVRLEKLGFTVSRNDIPSDDVPRGSVISQDPPAGTMLGEGALVTIDVSTGQTVSEDNLPEDSVRVPAVTDLKQAQAKTVLIASGLKLGEVSGEGGSVSSQDPEAGEVVKKGTRVDITVVEENDTEEETIEEVREELTKEAPKPQEYKISLDAPDRYEEGTAARILLKGKQSGIIYSQTKTTSFPVTICIPVKDIDSSDKEGVFMIIYTDDSTGKQMTDMSRKIIFKKGGS